MSARAWYTWLKRNVGGYWRLAWYNDSNATYFVRRKREDLKFSTGFKINNFMKQKASGIQPNAMLVILYFQMQLCSELNVTINMHNFLLKKLHIYAFLFKSTNFYSYFIPSNHRIRIYFAPVYTFHSKHSHTFVPRLMRRHVYQVKQRIIK